MPLALGVALFEAQLSGGLLELALSRLVHSSWLWGALNGSS